MAYLPKEKMVIEADLFDTHAPPPVNSDGGKPNLYNHVQRLRLDISTIVPIHGKPVPWSDFSKLFR